MFLMLVISRVSIVRTMSAESRIARVVSLKRPCSRRPRGRGPGAGASRIRLMPPGVISSAISGTAARAGRGCPAEWLMTNVSSDSSSPASSSGTRSAIDLFLGFRLSRTPTSPNWNEPSTRTTFLPSSVAAATARLTASVVRPTPPLGLKTATTRPGSPARRSVHGAAAGVAPAPRPGRRGDPAAASRARGCRPGGSTR